MGSSSSSSSSDDNDHDDDDDVDGRDGATEARASASAPAPEKDTQLIFRSNTSMSSRSIRTRWVSPGPIVTVDATDRTEVIEPDERGGREG